MKKNEEKTVTAAQLLDRVYAAAPGGSLSFYENQYVMGLLGKRRKFTQEEADQLFKRIAAELG